MQVLTSGGWGRPSGMSLRQEVVSMEDELHQLVHRASVPHSDHIVLEGKQEQRSVCRLVLNILST